MFNLQSGVKRKSVRFQINQLELRHSLELQDFKNRLEPNESDKEELSSYPLKKIKINNKVL